MKDLTRKDAVDATDILNDFIGDLVAGVMVLIEYRAILLNDPAQKDALVAIQKMCLSHLILTLYKWLEFYEKYHSLFDGELKAECKELTKRIKSRNIDAFRNKCVGHIWDKEKKRPMYNSEIDKYLNKIMLNDIQKFLLWLNNPRGNKYPESVVSIIEKCRENIVKKHDINHEEIMQR